jgi:hypothetical protein
MDAVEKRRIGRTEEHHETPSFRIVGVLNSG